MYRNDRIAMTAEHNNPDLATMALNSQPNIVLLIDQSGQIAYANETAVIQLGYSRDKLFDLAILELDPTFPLVHMPPETGDEAGRGGNNFRSSLRKADGSMLRVDISVTFLQVDNHPWRCLSALPVAEAPPEPREQGREDFLRNLADEVPLMVMAFNSDKEIVFWNEACRLVTGYRPEEIIGQTGHWKKLLPVARERHDFMKELACPGQDFREKTVSFTASDGSAKTLRWFDPSGRYPVPGWEHWIAAVDVTDIVRTEEALLDTQARFKGAFDDAALGMIIFSIGGRFLEVNSCMCQILGYSQEELLTKTFNDLTHPEDRQKSIQTDQKILDGIIPFGWVEKRYIRKDGLIVWVISSSTLIRDQDGKPLYFVSHVQDVTGRHQAEEALKEANTALKVLIDHREQEKIQLQRDLVNNVEKLALPYLDKLLSGRLDREQKTYLEIINNNLIDITSQFAHQLSSMESKLTPAELEVADLIRHGKSTDEIAGLLNSSPYTVSVHRRHIRRKLGLTNQQVNLKTYLRSFA